MKFNAMDIDAAIAAHKAWRSRFCIAIEGIDADKLDDLSVTDHTSCVLGTWLYSPKQQECLNLSVFRDILETLILLLEEFKEIAPGARVQE